jgi:hypothetical protein
MKAIGSSSLTSSPRNGLAVIAGGAQHSAAKPGVSKGRQPDMAVVRGSVTTRTSSVAASWSISPCQAEATIHFLATDSVGLTLVNPHRVILLFAGTAPHRGSVCADAFDLHQVLCRYLIDFRPVGDIGN